jgi:hypothetical protein
MSEIYQLKEVHVTIRSGVTVIAHVDNVDGISRLLSDLNEKKLIEPLPPSRKANVEQDEHTAGTPERRIEVAAGIVEGALAKSNTLAFKDNVPELLGTAQLSVTDAVLILLVALETGLKRTKVDYESFKALYEAQNIKSGSPLSMKLTDLKNDGYIDKKVYADEKCVRLTAKGQKKAIEALKDRIAVKSG